MRSGWNRKEERRGRREREEEMREERESGREIKGVNSSFQAS